MHSIQLASFKLVTFLLLCKWLILAGGYPVTWLPHMMLLVKSILQSHAWYATYIFISAGYFSVTLEIVKFGWELSSYMVTTYDATCQIHSTPTCIV